MCSAPSLKLHDYNDDNNDNEDRLLMPNARR